MEKLKIYITPSMEILAYTAQNIMIISGEELPGDPGDAPQRRKRMF